jgi:hypothetical protein
MQPGPILIPEEADKYRSISMPGWAGKGTEV